MTYMDVQRGPPLEGHWKGGGEGVNMIQVQLDMGHCYKIKKKQDSNSWIAVESLTRAALEALEALPQMCGAHLYTKEQHCAQW